MPKIVNHEERRAELAAAVWRVILRSGLESVSIRSVAAEAGLSTGALRHYFRTKEELLVGADRLLIGRVIGRLRQRPRGTSARDRARTAIQEILPVDPERRAEAAIWFAFASRSFAKSQIAHQHRNVFDGTRELCDQVMQELAMASELTPGRDPEREARRLHALIDGLVVQILIGRLPEDEALDVLDDHLEAIMSSPTPAGTRAGTFPTEG